jgi:hypothetical protein
MLLWQLKNVRNRHLLWLKLLACSLVVHIFFVMMFFFGYRDAVSSHALTIYSSMPSRNVVVVLNPTPQPAHTPQSKQITNTSTTPTIAQKPSVTPKIESKKAPTQVASPKATPAKQPTSAKKVSPNPKKTQVNTKATPLKKTTPAKPVQQKKEAAKSQSKPIVKEHKPRVQPIEENKPVNKAEQQPIAPSTQQSITEVNNTLSTQIEIPYTHAREFYQQEALRKEISRHWKPPHGMPDTCSCEITTHVGNNGVITDSIITQSSGILMYDVSARAAVLTMALPQWTWGTSFTLTFKP